MSIWIPTEQRCKSYGIFHRKFRCRVKYGLGRSIDDIRTHGHYITGDDSRDYDTQHENVLRFITIDDMVEYWRRGVQIDVADSKDTKTIYDIIDEYLTFQREHIYNDILPPHPELMQDLYDLDAFAGKVYEHARVHLDKEFHQSIVNKGLRGVFRYNASTLFRSAPQEMAKDDHGFDEPVYPQRAAVFDTASNVQAGGFGFIPSVGGIDTDEINPGNIWS